MRITLSPQKSLKYLSSPSAEFCIFLYFICSSDVPNHCYQITSCILHFGHCWSHYNSLQNDLHVFKMIKRDTLAISVLHFQTLCLNRRSQFRDTSKVNSQLAYIPIPKITTEGNWQSPGNTEGIGVIIYFLFSKKHNKRLYVFSVNSHKLGFHFITKINVKKF